MIKSTAAFIIGRIIFGYCSGLSSFLVPLFSTLYIYIYIYISKRNKPCGKEWDNGMYTPINAHFWTTGSYSAGFVCTTIELERWRTGRLQENRR